jgi:hypothetical protein
VPDFSAVWTAIVNDLVTENPTNRRLWSLPNGIMWIGGIQELYNRPCYDEITGNIISLSRVLVKGTPGIGKSLYLQILLVHLARRAKTEGREPPSIVYVYRIYGVLVKLFFLPDGSVVDISGGQRPPPPDYELSDSVDLEAPAGKILSLLVASDKEVNYNTFHKRIQEAQEKGETFVMNLFAFDELCAIKPTSMDVAVATFRHQIFGGSARNFLAVSKGDDVLLPVVDGTMTLMFSDIKESHYDAWDVAAHQVSAALVEKDVANPAAVVNSMMRHYMRLGSSGAVKVWASKFMAFLAADIVETRSDDISKELQKLFGRSGMGNMFELMGHRKLVQSSQPFSLKRLFPPSFTNRSSSKKTNSTLPRVHPPLFESAWFNLPMVRFNHISEISSIPDGTYGIPLNAAFPVADAIIQPDTILQFTISPKDHKGSLASLADLRAQLHEKEQTKHRIIFVIPKENFESFRYQSDLKDIRQFVCLSEPSVVRLPKDEGSEAEGKDAGGD